MFSTRNLFADIVIIVGVILIIGSVFQFRQTRKMNLAVQRLGQKAPRMFRGMYGRVGTRKVYLFAATKKDGMIIDASFMVTPSLFSKMQEVRADQLIGKKIPAINPEEFNNDQTVYHVVCNLKEDFQKRHNE